MLTSAAPGSSACCATARTSNSARSAIARAQYAAIRNVFSQFNLAILSKRIASVSHEAPRPSAAEHLSQSNNLARDGRPKTARSATHSGQGRLPCGIRQSASNRGRAKHQNRKGHSNDDDTIRENWIISATALARSIRHCCSRPGAAFRGATCKYGSLANRDLLHCDGVREHAYGGDGVYARTRACDTILPYG